MADSKRQKIVDLIVARMKLIQIANDYETDYGSNVKDWQINFNENDIENEFPVISISDGNSQEEWETPPDDKIGYSNLDVDISLLVAGEVAVTEIRKGLADIYKAIGTDTRWKDNTGTGLAMWTMPVSTEIRPPLENFEFTMGQVSIRIRYKTLLFNAYE